jgi:drug/metabolite transporter (DMT)-like permease
MIKGIDKGVVFMFFSALLSALNGAFAKVLGEDMSALEIVFFRNLLGVFIILYTLKHTPSKLPGGNIKLLIWRGLFGFSAMLFFFYTITTIPLGEAVTLNKTSPLFVSILAFLLLNEKLSKIGVFSLFIGFFGVILITKPFGMDVGLSHILGLLGGILAAAAYTTIRKIKHIYDSRVIVLSFMATGVVIPFFLFIISEFYSPKSLDFLLSKFIMPTSLKAWVMITFMAVTATASQWLLTKAYSSTNAGIIGIVSYIIIPFSLTFGFLLGDNIPDTMTMIGIVLIVIAGLLVKKG